MWRGKRSLEQTSDPSFHTTKKTRTNNSLVPIATERDTKISMDDYSNFIARTFIVTREAQQTKGACNKKLFLSIPKMISEFTCHFRKQQLVFRLTDRPPSCGVNGVVLFYQAVPASSTTTTTTTTTATTIHRLCVKHTVDMAEAAVVQRFESTGVACGQVQARLIYQAENGRDYYTRNSEREEVYAFAMPVYTGTLSDFTGQNTRLDRDTICRIIKELHQHLLCLQDLDGPMLCYMDIKPDNILYKLANENDTSSIIVTVGDLGSDSKSTLSCPVARNPRRPRCTSSRERACMKFHLIILSANLLLPEQDFKALDWVNYAYFPINYFKTHQHGYWKTIQRGKEKKEGRGEGKEEEVLVSSPPIIIQNRILAGATSFINNNFHSLRDILVPL